MFEHLPGWVWTERIHRNSLTLMPQGKATPSIHWPTDAKVGVGRVGGWEPWKFEIIPTVKGDSLNKWDHRTVLGKLGSSVTKSKMKGPGRHCLPPWHILGPLLATY